MPFFHSLLPYPLPLPVLPYFFTFRHLPLPVFVIPLLGHFTMSGLQSMQNMPWSKTISQNTRKWNHILCGIINPLFCHWTYDMGGYFLHCSYFFLFPWGMENMMKLTKYPMQTYYMFNPQLRCIFPSEVRGTLKVKMSCPRTKHNGQTKAQQLRSLWLWDGHKNKFPDQRWN